MFEAIAEEEEEDAEFYHDLTTRRGASTPHTGGRAAGS